MFLFLEAFSTVMFSFTWVFIRSLFIFPTREATVKRPHSYLLTIVPQVQSIMFVYSVCLINIWWINKQCLYEVYAWQILDSEAWLFHLNGGQWPCLWPFEWSLDEAMSFPSSLLLRWSETGTLVFGLFFLFSWVICLFSHFDEAQCIHSQCQEPLPPLVKSFS